MQFHEIKCIESRFVTVATAAIVTRLFKTSQDSPTFATLTLFHRDGSIEVVKDVLFSDSPGERVATIIGQPTGRLPPPPTFTGGFFDIDRTSPPHEPTSGR